MTVMLRVALIFVSVFTMTFMMRKIRQAKMEIEAALFWVIMLLCWWFSPFFPLWQILCQTFGNLCHNEFSVSVYDLSADRKLFSMTVHISQLESRQRELIQKMALEKRFKEEEEEMKDGDERRTAGTVSEQVQ